MTNVIDGIRCMHGKSNCVDCVTKNTTHLAHSPDHEQYLDGIKKEEDNYAYQTVPVYAQTHD